MRQALFTVMLTLALAGSAHAAAQVDATWGDNSANEDGFKLERCQGTGCTNFADILQVGPNVVTASDTSVVEGQTYCYRVYAHNLGGDSPRSNTACATIPILPPNAPGPISVQIKMSSTP